MDFSDITQVKRGIAIGDLIIDGSKLYTREEWLQISHAKSMVDQFDLLQLTKKIQL